MLWLHHLEWLQQLCEVNNLRAWQGKNSFRFPTSCFCSLLCHVCAVLAATNWLAGRRFLRQTQSLDWPISDIDRMEWHWSHPGLSWQGHETTLFDFVCLSMRGKERTAYTHPGLKIDPSKIPFCCYSGAHPSHHSWYLSNRDSRGKNQNACTSLQNCQKTSLFNYPTRSKYIKLIWLRNR